MIRAAGLLLALACGAPVAAQRAAVDVVEHRVRDGETLSGLAARYGAVGGWPAIARANGVSRERALRPGTVLRIPVAARLAMATASVTSWRGPVTVISGGRARVVTMPVTVREGDSIATGAGGFATVTLGDGSRSSLPSNSRVRLERLRGGPRAGAQEVRFVLESGGVDTQAARQRSGDRFEIRTAVGVAAVRGTEFRVAADGGGPARAEVLEGAVGFAVGAAEQRVPGGFGTVATEAGARPPVPLLPPPVFAGGNALRDGEVAVAVAAVPGARGYRFDLATDAGFQDRLAQLDRSGPEVRFEGVGSGDLFVRAQAVDPDGLVGLPNVRAVKVGGPLSDAKPTPGAARCPAQVACLLFRFAGDAGGTRLLIARDAAGADVVVDRRGLPGDRATIVALPPGEYWFATEAGTPVRRTVAQRITLAEPASGGR